MKTAVGYKPEFLKGNVLIGKTITLKMPNGEQRQAAFAIVDLSDILASHNEKTYGNTAGYPVDEKGENINDRNYTSDISSQSKIIEFAQNLEPDRLITTSRTPSGSPIITVDGIVISGNNRTMSLKLAAADYPEKYQEYKEFLGEEIEAFGFDNITGASLLNSDPVSIEGPDGHDQLSVKFKHPVLVRIDYDFPRYDTMELAKYNKDTKKSERPIDKALKLGKMLQASERCTNVISEVVSRYETFSELYANSADIKAMKETLISCNILTTQEIPAFFTEIGFTEAGKELIENMLAGLVLSKDALFASNEGGAKVFRQTIITSLPVITANLSLGKEDSLNDIINQAVVMQNKMSSAKLSFKDYAAQGNMFAENKDSKQAMYMNRLLASGRNNFKRSLEGYNASVTENKGESLFGDKPTKADIFKTYIEDHTPAEDRAIIEKTENQNVVQAKPQPPIEKTGHPEIKGITAVNYEDDGKTMLYGSKNRKTRVSVARLTQKEIKDELEFEQEKLKSEVEELPNLIRANESAQNSFTTSTKDKDLNRKALEEAKLGIEISEKLVIPFYQSKLESKTEARMETETTIAANPFVGGNFFKEKPENILAKTVESTDRWKKKITEYKGSLEDLKRIQADETFLSASAALDPLTSVVAESVFAASQSDTQVVDNLQRALEESTKEEPKKTLRKAKNSKLKAADLVKETRIGDSYTISEVWDMINQEVSVDELRAFMWWKHHNGRPIENNEWLALTGLTADELYKDETLVTAWVEDGLLYYYDGELMPAYLYLAENVYDKKTRLVPVKETQEGKVAGSGQDKEPIIEKYGQGVYDAQVKALEDVFQKQYEKRLTLSGPENPESLVISPVSDFAKKFTIKTLIDELPFRWKKITAGSNKSFGKPDFLATPSGDRDKADFESLSLTDAFAYWLRTDDTIQYQKGMNYADIIKIYLQAKSKPGTEAHKDDDGHYSGEQLKIKKKEDAEWERLKSKAKSEADRLFQKFLENFLTANDKVKIETQWNRDYNGYVKINYNKVPVAFPCNRYDMGKPMEIKPEKREAVAFTFSEGSGLLAYDVGVGKTPSAIFTICQFLATGYAKRPVLVVPNQTYKQWISEFEKFASHIRINQFYNMSKEYIDDWKDVNGVTKQVAEGTVSIMTYEGMKQMGFQDKTLTSLKPEIGAILLQASAEGLSAKKADREAEKLDSKVEEIIGRALSKSIINIEELGFDFISFDEAHACKKVFTYVKGEKEENLGNSGKGTRSVSRYEIKSGEPSFNGVKGFMFCHYIQKTYQGNTLLLTATPFTNSPLEVYSMLAMVARAKLKNMGLDNLSTFFDTYVNISYEMIINSKLKPERRQVILGFNNLISLQTLVRRFINYKTGEEVKVPRPNKIVLPLRSKMIDGIKVILGEDERVETILPLTDVQANLMSRIKQYAEGEISEDVMCTMALHEESENEDEARAEGVEIDEDSMDQDEKVGVRLLKAMNHARNLALSPYIFDCSGLGKPTYEKYINTSNKLKYVIESIRSIKDHHADRGTDMSGVVIYMDRGVEYFNLIREYLIKDVGFADHEVGIISSKVIVPIPAGTPKDEQKEYVKNLFLGERFNKDTLLMEKLPAEQRCKVLIGSSTIKEGINLQKHSSALFNCWMDWNPTDIQQLEGRIYRQGNKFKTVRIVNPLMIDSMDIFMFQKLEEKTSRINTIWQNDGRTNVLKTEEFNPKELKYSLIKDPIVLAEMELLEVGEKIGEEIADTQNMVKRNEKIKGYASTIESHTEDLEEWLEKYRPLAEGQPKRPIEAMIRLAQEVLTKQTDKLGKRMMADWQRDKKKPAGFYSTEHLSEAHKPYWFDDLNFANRNLKREERDYLKPRGIEVKNLDKYSAKLEKKIDQLAKDKEKAVSPDAIKIKAAEIMEYRKANEIEERSVPQCIEDFKKLNYLLDELVTQDKMIEIVKQCPPVDAQGKPRVDSEGLLLLNECVNEAPDTKRMHSTETTDEEGNKVLHYTAERKALHEKIIKEITGNAVCIQRTEPIAILTGGAPGSGKSTFMNKYMPYLKTDLIWKVDADAVREQLPEYEGWNSAATHNESRDIVNELITSFDKPCKHDLLYDGTMSNAQKYIPLVAKLKKMGYKVFIVYMEVPKQVSIDRALSRYVNNKSGKSKYGRYVPVSVIDDFYATGKAGFEEIKSAVDGYILVDSMTQKIVDKGGMEVPADRNYGEMFTKGKEKALLTEEQTANTQQRDEITFALEYLTGELPTLKGKKKKECEFAIEFIREQIPTPEMCGGGVIDGNADMVMTQDGVAVERKGNKHIGHIFYSEDGQQFKCLGYNAKVDDCEFLNLQTNKHIFGCVKGFWFNKPDKKQGSESELRAELAEVNEKIKAPHEKGVNYVALIDRRRAIADELYEMSGGGPIGGLVNAREGDYVISNYLGQGKVTGVHKDSVDALFFDEGRKKYFHKNILKSSHDAVLADGTGHDKTGNKFQLSSLFTKEMLGNYPTTDLRKMSTGGPVDNTITSENYQFEIAKYGEYFDAQQIINIEKVVEHNRDNLSGKIEGYGSGGDTYHVLVQLKDKTWLGFHNASGDVTLSEPFESLGALLDDFQGEGEKVVSNVIGNINGEEQETEPVKTTDHEQVWNSLKQAQRLELMMDNGWITREKKPSGVAINASKRKWEKLSPAITNILLRKPIEAKEKGGKVDSRKFMVMYTCKETNGLKRPKFYSKEEAQAFADEVGSEVTPL